MDNKIIHRLTSVGIVTKKIHYAQGAQRHYEGHRWFGWGRKDGQIVYFGSHFTATECANPKRTFTISLDPFGSDIEVDCRK